ncbi:hypothetical protein JDV02_001013 [Purpureocillium takamizusanense]|uniref:Uncharacterized protein n=1 Tax=Purpureocillium takamizusanense TaxID=2060973 RepID=A0A9Q8Q5X6_9HYPO|nr:uncharacterized protein JDV02_001013 [Purpureocillium takamizusanense]UNI14379.1 hypothetical protein JDV02_001013 [Purpureocillium takamizusanense]
MIILFFFFSSPNLSFLLGSSLRLAQPRTPEHDKEPGTYDVTSKGTPLLHPPLLSSLREEWAKGPSILQQHGPPANSSRQKERRHSSPGGPGAWLHRQQVPSCTQPTDRRDAVRWGRRLE